MRSGRLRTLCALAALGVALGAGYATAAPHDTVVSSRSNGTGPPDAIGVRDGSRHPSVSAIGRHVAFESDAANLVSGDGNGQVDVFLRDHQTHTTTLVSRAGDGSQAVGGASADPAVSADARYVAFESNAANLVPESASPGLPPTYILVRDRVEGTTTLVSRASGSDPPEPNVGASSDPAISADGRYVAFTSSANTLVPGDTNGRADIFVRDLETDVTRVVSRSTGAGAPDANQASQTPSISADGSRVAFTSAATNLVGGDANARSDVFVRDLATETTSVVSRPAGSGAPDANGNSGSPAISADGRHVAFDSLATNLVPGDAENLQTDVFVRDTEDATTAIVSRSGGEGPPNGNNNSSSPTISADGRWVAFSSSATNLVDGDGNGRGDVFVRDRQLAATTVASRSTGEGPPDADNGSLFPSLSGDGRYVAFNSVATNIVAPDVNGVNDVFRRELAGASAPPMVSIDDVTVTEGDAGEVDATFTASLSVATEQPVTVDFATADGTAHAPADYTAGSGTLTFAPDDVSESVTVRVKGDTRDEPDETFSVNLSAVDGAGLADAQGLGSIVDDDDPPAAGYLSIDDVTVAEGDAGEVDATFTVSLSAPATHQVTVDFATADGTAHAPADYTARTGTLTFAPDEIDKTLTVRVKGDTLDEGYEDLFVNLSDPDGAGLADAQGLATIVDDDHHSLAAGVPARLGAITRPGEASPPLGPARRRRCLAFRGGVRGRRLGPARLRRRQVADRRSFGSVHRRTARGIDRYCMAGGGTLSIRYATAGLIRGLGRSAARRRRGRAVLVLTTSRRYRIAGIGRGSSSRLPASRLRGGRRVRLGRSDWYLVPSRGRRLVFRIRGRRVLAVGLAESALTRTRRQARMLLRSV